MKHFFIFLAVLALFSGCASEDPPHADIGVAYFPLKKGLYQVYDVSETHYAAGTEPEVIRYELMVTVADSFPSADDGVFTYVLHRSRRATATDPWQPLDTWSASRNNFRAQLSEGNTAFVKMIFPVRIGTVWDGNAFNNIGVDEYRLAGDGKFVGEDGTTFDNTIHVEQENNDDRIVFYDVRSEVYAHGVGLVYKEVSQLSYCTDDQCLGQQQIENGVEIKQVMKQYGEL